MRKLTLTDGLIGLAFLIGLFFRMAGLGLVPLNDSEATWALQALQLTRGQATIGGEAGLVVWSSALFRIFEPTTFLARFFPALIGSAVVFIPALLQKRLGSKTSVVLAFGLAIDPLLVGTSRQADGLSMAVVLAGLAASLWILRKSLAFGIVFGFYLVCGPAAWLGLTILILILIVHWLIFGSKPLWADLVHTRMNWGWIGLGIGLGLFVGGTLLLLVPNGLSGMMTGFVDYLASWKTSDSNPVTATQIFMALFSYLGLPLILAILSGIHAILSKDGFELQILAYGLCVAVLLIIFPGFAVRSLVWLSPILWVLSARQISRIDFIHWNRSALMMGFITIVMAVFIFFNVNALVTTAEPELRLSAIVVSILIVLLSMFLVWWGWSLIDARKGLGMGLLMVFLAATLTSTWRVTGLNGRLDAEMISVPAFTDADLLEMTVHDFSTWNTGEKNVLDIVTTGVQSPALDWSLRNFENYQKANAILPGQEPGIIISPEDYELNQTAPYTGQKFTLTEIHNWGELDARGWIGWLVRREAVSEPKSILLWVRSDLFPGASIPGNSQE